MRLSPRDQFRIDGEAKLDPAGRLWRPLLDLPALFLEFLQAARNRREVVRDSARAHARVPPSFAARLGSGWAGCG